MSPTATEQQHQQHQPYADCDDLRTAFTLAMSAMYKAEVPLYGDLVRIVSSVNQSALFSSSSNNSSNNNSNNTAPLDPKVLAMRRGDVVPSRLDIERHGAIRLGTPHELRTIRRVFALIGLQPVGYYNLSAAGLPMHATCFRPRHAASLRRNPFRVFTSVLRPDLIRDPQAKALALDLLSKRDIFTPELIRLLDRADAQGGRLTPDQGEAFVREAMHTFRWHGTAAASYRDYQCLKSEHPILADVACFRSAHINHLTPRTLAISAAQEHMHAEGLRVKDRIEGPPGGRACPILLRQTSFLAIEEPIKFLPASDGAEPGSPLVDGLHRARFGEIEERGAAVTPAGRKLYDELLHEAMTASQRSSAQPKPEDLDVQLQVAFQKYPDDWNELRKRGLIYSTFRCTEKANASNPPVGENGNVALEDLLDKGIVEAFPITYEDFLPLSAAGIFQSNLGSQSSQTQHVEAPSDVRGMEEALGMALLDPDELYRSMERESVAQCAAELGLDIIP